MLRRLNNYFTNKGYLVTEREYMADHAAPFRLESIKKYLGGWTRMVYYIGFYYPRWKQEEPVKVETKVVEPKADPLEALKKRKVSEENSHEESISE